MKRNNRRNNNNNDDDDHDDDDDTELVVSPGNRTYRLRFSGVMTPPLSPRQHVMSIAEQDEKEGGNGGFEFAYETGNHNDSFADWLKAYQQNHIASPEVDANAKANANDKTANVVVSPIPMKVHARLSTKKPKPRSRQDHHHHVAYGKGNANGGYNATTPLSHSQQAKMTHQIYHHQINHNTGSSTENRPNVGQHSPVMESSPQCELRSPIMNLRSPMETSPPDSCASTGEWKKMLRVETQKQLLRGLREVPFFENQQQEEHLVRTTKEGELYVDVDLIWFEPGCCLLWAVGSVELV